MKYYTGIGARGTPDRIGKIMTALARKLDNDGFILRSGGASGADTFFEDGATHADIFLPWSKFNGRMKPTVGKKEFISKYSKEIASKAERLASEVHPAWDNCNGTVRKFHARNAHQVLGRLLDDPTEFVVFWAVPDGDQVKGGTNTAVQMAKNRGIPTYNLYDDEVEERIMKYVIT